MLGRWWPRRRPTGGPETAAASATGRIDVVRSRPGAPAATASGAPPAPGRFEPDADWWAWLLDRPSAPAADPTAADLDTLAAQAEAVDVTRLPRLPALLPTLLAALRREDVTAQALADCIARDPVVAGEVLRVAGSAYYARGATIAGLVPAVQRLGHDGLRRVALAVLMRPIAQAHGPAADALRLDRLWDHTQRTMAACALLAPGRCDAAEAQLAAVIGTTGATALLRHLPPATIERLAGPATARRLSGAGARITRRAAAYWQLPEPVQQAWERLAEGRRTDEPLTAVLETARRLAMASTLVEAGRLDADAIDTLALSTAIDPELCRTAAARLRREFGGETGA